MATITMGDGKSFEVADGTTVAQFVQQFAPTLASSAIVGRVDGALVDLASRLNGAKTIEIISDKDADGLYVIRHSTAHVLAQSLRRLYGPGVQYTIGPVITNG